MTARNYSRYVAIGDSQTEGLWDGDDTAGVIGFADRLAAMLDQLWPGVQYANLAVRGRTIADALKEQLPQALSMHPDLITVCIGMNDTTRPGAAFDRALIDLDRIYAELAASGATVVTTTFPDIARLLPIGRILSTRLERINERIRTAAEDYGFGLVDLFAAPSMLHPSTWSPDRMHASTTGHMRFAAAAAEALGLPGSNHDWAHPPASEASAGLFGASKALDFATRARAQLDWTTNMFLPWAWHTLRGRSSGDGRSPKRPHLTGGPSLCP